MPLRFRSVVPYTLPGVLVLIGWWWYTSRKKERLTGHDKPRDAPATAALRTVGSNGVCDKGTVTPTNDTEHHVLCRHSTVTSQDDGHENISQALVQDAYATCSLGQTSKDAASDVDRPPVSALPPYERGDGHRKEHGCSQKIPQHALATEAELYIKSDLSAVKEIAPPCRSTKVPHSVPASACLLDKERPEPEGEVAENHNAVMTQNDGCVVTPAKVQGVTPSQFDSLDDHASLHDFNQHILTSTPTSSPLLTSDAQTASLTEREVPNHGAEQNLEVLAAGLITEVISAATQQVLGVASCQVADQDKKCHHRGLSDASQTHHEPPQVEVKRSTEQVMPNGCSAASVWGSEVSGSVHQADDTRGDPLPKLSHQAATSTPLPSLNPKGVESTTRAEDSACSTCYSEDGVSTEDQQLFDKKRDIFQVRDLSEKEDALPQSLVETATEAMILALTEEDSVNVNRPDGMDLRNGAHGACEVETDQSGGSDVNSMDSGDSGCTMGAGEGHRSQASSSSSDLVFWEIEVPKLLVGRLIGKQGRYVSFLKQTSGAKIYISTLPYTQEFQICHIEGMQQQVDKALSLIGKKFKDLDLTNLYVPPQPPLTLPSLPMTSWLLLPSGVTVEVIVVNIVSAGHVFVQQHTHPTYHALRSLDQQMFLCYSQPGTPTLPSPAEVGVICAAPAVEGAWWRAQVITFYKESNEVEIRYVDYGGYDRVNIDSLRQIRSDFVTLPFQGAEVLLDNIAPLPGEDRFSSEATSTLEEMTRGVSLLAQVSNYDSNTGLPLVHLWNIMGEEVISINRSLAERGLGVWVDGF
uniref:A kinase (PRKA) anchor protein 1b n=1 Tax=Doryrhamphus excisus TaxID=161450 RepID=UPI0025AE1312|nr:A kinase (PRKA) anchor protein 1b [Doryrhamphus excisus]XP_057936468.1 A kinase (PRKA) anchor protein 1b [Doryrhamphus excisus]XP_057936469.1 A kinase (PRKA) anchor protein 1b [Doryrhamphus excisus]